jgi:HD-like signal output (HDOD) protein
MAEAQRITSVDPEIFRIFQAFDSLSDEDLLLLATKSAVLSEKRDHRLFEHGSNDPWTICLIDGTVELEAKDGAKKQIEGGSPAARRPLAQLKPRQFTATALSPVTFLRIDNSTLGDYMNGIISSRYEVEELGMEGDMELTSELLWQQHNELVDNTMQLPSLPAVALKVNQLIEQDDVDVSSIAKAVNSDPAIAAKLIRAANSPLYHGQAQADSCERAIVRLGMGTTRQLVMSFAMRELFTTESPALQKRMAELWRHSTEVAAICFVLAQKTKKFEPEQAMLAGLLHDIGIVPLLAHAEQQPNLAKDQAALEQLLNHNRGKVGTMMLRKWNFPEKFVVAAAHAEEWERNSGNELDYADLVIVAQLHGFIGTSKMPKIPPMDALPAFQKLTEGNVDPRASLEILKQAKQEIEQLRSLLRG